MKLLVHRETSCERIAKKRGNFLKILQQKKLQSVKKLIIIIFACRFLYMRVIHIDFIAIKLIHCNIVIGLTESITLFDANVYHRCMSIRFPLFIHKLQQQFASLIDSIEKHFRLPNTHIYSKKYALPFG